MLMGIWCRPVAVWMLTLTKWRKKMLIVSRPFLFTSFPGLEKELFPPWSCWNVSPSDSKVHLLAPHQRGTSSPLCQFGRAGGKHRQTFAYSPERAARNSSVFRWHMNLVRRSVPPPPPVMGGSVMYRITEDVCTHKDSRSCGFILFFLFYTT